MSTLAPSSERAKRFSTLKVARRIAAMT